MDPAIPWLMEGDPAIRWRAMRDLLDSPESDWQAERLRTAESGWGARLLAAQDADGRWGGGIYTPKWTSTTYTLLMLCDIGIPREHEAARRGAELAVGALLGEACGAGFHEKLDACDQCITGMMLRLAVYFGLDDGRVEAIADNLLSRMMPDGAWNCRHSRRPKPHHSSFHTTFNVLDGLREYVESRRIARRGDALAAERRALELVLQHRLFKSDKTGEIIRPKFTMLSYPPRWHYDVLRGLDYFVRAGAPRDSRMQDAVDLLIARRREDGLWPVQARHTGKAFFEMERIGGPSRWNTLRALRVLRWWGG